MPDFWLDFASFAKKEYGVDIVLREGVATTFEKLFPDISAALAIPSYSFANFCGLEVQIVKFFYYINYTYTIYIPKQNPIHGFGETNFIFNHEIMSSDIVEIQKNIGRNLIVGNNLQPVRVNLWSPPKPPEADVVITNITLLSTMKE